VTEFGLQGVRRGGPASQHCCTPSGLRVDLGHETHLPNHRVSCDAHVGSDSVHTRGVYWRDIDADQHDLVVCREEIRIVSGCRRVLGHYGGPHRLHSLCFPGCFQERVATE